jgi:hypothetical protein
MPSEKTSGRHTPKGTAQGVKGGRSTPRATANAAPKKAAESGPGYASSGRYTPPTARVDQLAESPAWVAPLMFALFLIGLVVIVLNLTEVLPGAPTNWYTLGGLVVILSGFVAATRLR